MRPGGFTTSSGTLVYSNDTGAVTVNYWAFESFLGCQAAGVAFGTS
jgi:hypothetical protein